MFEYSLIINGNPIHTFRTLDETITRLFRTYRSEDEVALVMRGSKPVQSYVFKNGIWYPLYMNDVAIRRGHDWGGHALFTPDANGIYHAELAD